MAKTPLWKAIADILRRDIVSGHYRQGDKLPTEAALAARFSVNRHTVRHALRVLAEEGMVLPRRGAGVFVTAVATEYPLGRRVRYHQNLRAAGRIPAKRVLHLVTRPADAREAEALQLDEAAEVHAYEGLSLADGQPIALFRTVFPAASFPGLAGELEKSGSVTRALQAAGVADYTRAWTRLNAKLANATQAAQLRIAEGAPILRSISVNVDPAGQPIEYGRTWFAADRVTLTLDQP
ncbi:MAG: phosphonate metabolism transcriptional regulator PhnF [Pseudomonadota bacterium]